jgi:Creatinase/Prolidase N-terminal domain
VRFLLCHYQSCAHATLDVAHILNLHSDDIPFSPIFFSYLYIGQDCAILFVEQDKIELPVREYLQNLRVELRDYNRIWSFLRTANGAGKVRTPTVSLVVDINCLTDIICHLAYVDAPPLLPRSFNHRGDEKRQNEVESQGQ